VIVPFAEYVAGGFPDSYCHVPSPVPLVPDTATETGAPPVGDAGTSKIEKNPAKVAPKLGTPEGANPEGASANRREKPRSV
jgi:hypothetical protein